MGRIVYTRGGQVKAFPTGFSWTTLFFGPIPSAIRGQWTAAIVIFCANLGAFAVSAFLFGAADRALVPLGVQVLCAALRNAYLHRFLPSHGWRIGNPAPLYQFTAPANDGDTL